MSKGLGFDELFGGILSGLNQNQGQRNDFPWDNLSGFNAREKHHTISIKVTNGVIEQIVDLPYQYRSPLNVDVACSVFQTMSREELLTIPEMSKFTYDYTFQFTPYINFVLDVKTEMPRRQY